MDFNSQRDPKVLELEATVVKNYTNKIFKETYNHALELFISKVKTEALNSEPKRKYCNPDNLTPGQRAALKDMASWKEAVIRPFDKGTGFFILDREDYIERVEVHLKDEETYERIEDKEQAKDDVIKKIGNWIDKYAEEPGMSTKIKDWVLPTKDQKPGNMYINPKAHKPEKNYPGRLISTGCDSYIKNLSILTAHQLKEVPLRYCLKDTGDFLRLHHKVNQEKTLETNDETFLVTFDIVNMFPYTFVCCLLVLTTKPRKFIN